MIYVIIAALSVIALAMAVLAQFCVTALMVETTVGVDTYTEEEKNEQ